MGGVDQTGEGPLAAARIASSVPGRLRLRLADGADRLDRIAAAAEMVGARADVTGSSPAGGPEAWWSSTTLPVARACATR